LGLPVPDDYEQYAEQLEKEMEEDLLSNLCGGDTNAYSKTWDGVVKRNLDKMKNNQPQLDAYNRIIDAINNPHKTPNRLFFVEGSNIILL
jgi:hypothetical protein